MCVTTSGPILAASGNGEAALKKFKEGLDLAARDMKGGPEVAQSYTCTVLLTKKVGEA